MVRLAGNRLVLEQPDHNQQQQQHQHQQQQQQQPRRRRPEECQITIRTCAHLYNQWHSRGRLYKRVANKGGILMTIKYIDTGVTMSYHDRMKAPIVLAVHGAPGSYYDFDIIQDHLRKENVRLIAPNFPVMSETVKTIFRHSADEKAAYLMDFLSAIQVHRVDLLISHSSAVFPSLLMIGTNIYQTNDKNENKQHQNNINVFSKHRLQIRSLALFNPPGHRFPRTMKPYWFACGSVRFYHRKAGRALFRVFGPQVLKILGVPIRVDNMDDVMLSATVMKNSHCRRVEDQLLNISMIRLPTLLVFSENDKLIEKEIFYEMANFLKADSRAHFDYYDHEGNLERRGSLPDDWIRVIVFKAGGHYSFVNYGEIVGLAITKLVRRVCSAFPSPSTATAS